MTLDELDWALASSQTQEGESTAFLVSFLERLHHSRAAVKATKNQSPTSRSHTCNPDPFLRPKSLQGLIQQQQPQKAWAECTGLRPLLTCILVQLAGAGSLPT